MKINVNGVEGQIIHRSDKDISIRITNQNTNKILHSHIPYFARSRKSFNGKYGVETAMYLLQKYSKS